MTTIAFCVLGQMGAPMAGRLLDARHDLVVWNRSRGRGVALVERGARRAASAGEAAAGAGVVFTMLADPAALDQVVFGPDGVAAGATPDATLIEMSTVGPDVVRDLAARLPPGMHVLDAPVLGSVPQATEGSLKVFVGGDADVFERWRTLLEAMGTPTHLGPLGSGAAMKLVANSTLGAAMCGLAESPIGATVRGKRALIDGADYRPANFKLALAAKDLGLVTGAAEAAGVDLRLAPAAGAWFAQAEAAGLGDRDCSAVIAAARGQATGGA